MLLLLFAACGALSPAPEPPPALPGCRAVAEEGCFWMDNGPGETCWVPMRDADRAECFARDSCSGGGGKSNGGCYKWARCSTCAAEPWP